MKKGQSGPCFSVRHADHVVHPDLDDFDTGKPVTRIATDIMRPCVPIAPNPRGAE